MMKNFPFLAVAVLVLVSAASFAGTLRIGQPVIQGNQVTVPVLLEGDVADGVAALSFQLNYDPSMLEPRQAVPGAAAQSAGKDVMTNVKEPGTYMVVMAGMNNGTLAMGEVTNIVLERRGDNASTNISITGTTFASLQGDEIPSRGSTGSISFGEVEEDETEPPAAPDTPEDTPSPEQGGPDWGNRRPDSIPTTIPENESPSRRTTDPTPRTTPSLRREAGRKLDASLTEGASDAEMSKELAAALTAAAEGRLNIASRPSETRDAAQAVSTVAGGPGANGHAGELQTAAVPEIPDSQPGHETNAAIPGHAAAEPGASSVAPGTASASEEPRTAPSAASEERTAAESTGKGFGPAFIFAGALAVVAIGIVLLRKRLFR